MSKVIELSADFMRENPNFMGKLTPQQQKIWFSVFMGLLDIYDPYPGQTITILLEEIKAFVGSKQANKRFRQVVIEAFRAFDNCYAEKQNYRKPFYLEKIEKGIVYLHIGDYYIFYFQNLRGQQYIKINLDEISSYQQPRNSCSRTIPLLWYCLAHRHLTKDKSKWEITFGDIQLKDALGLDYADYIDVPNGQKKLFRDAAYWCRKEPTVKVAEEILQKYGLPRTEILSTYERLKKESSFNRWKFEQKVLLPAIEELNKGSMLNFILQDVWKRAPAGKPAQKVKSYIGKNYTKGDAVIVNGLIIDRNVTNFKKLEEGKQYHFLITKQE